MDYSYILRSALAKTETFASFGFEKNGSNYVCKKPLPSDGFYVLITYSESSASLFAHVYDSATGEKYPLFDMPAATGAFVGEIRTQVQSIIDDFRAKCFVSVDVREKYVAFIAERFAVTPDFPWDDSPDAGVFRCPNRKWFALIMRIKYRQLGFTQSGTADEDVWVVNLKADADRIPQIVDKKSIFPAYHMNKKYWITVLLTAVTNFEELCALTERSVELVAGKGKKCNPDKIRKNQKA